MKTLSGRVGAITGAGSGIGRALALEVSRRGGTVALCDVDEAGLSGTAGLVEAQRSEEHTSELQSLMRISYAVFCLKKKKNKTNTPDQTTYVICSLKYLRCST